MHPSSKPPAASQVGVSYQIEQFVQCPFTQKEDYSSTGYQALFTIGCITACPLSILAILFDTVHGTGRFIIQLTFSDNADFKKPFFLMSRIQLCLSLPYMCLIRIFNHTQPKIDFFGIDNKEQHYPHMVTNKFNHSMKNLFSCSRSTSSLFIFSTVLAITSPITLIIDHFLGLIVAFCSFIFLGTSSNHNTFAAQQLTLCCQSSLIFLSIAVLSLFSDANTIWNKLDKQA